MKPLLIESNGPILQDYFEHFCHFACQKLGIENCPPIKLVSKTGSSSFGNYHLSTKIITVATDGRHVADILRTLAHELVHEAQHMDSEVRPTHSIQELEYEANGLAGMIMREYNKIHPELYDAEETSIAIDTTEENGISDSQPMRPYYPIEIAEDAVVNSVSSGGIDGIGVGSKGEPGIHPNKKKKETQVLKRKTLQQFRNGLN